MTVISIINREPYGKTTRVEHGVKFPIDDDGRCDIKSMTKILGCELFDVVYIGNGIDMFVDDEGLYTRPDERNIPATTLRNVAFMKGSSEIPCNLFSIVGPAILAAVDESGNTIDLNEDQVKYIKSIIG